MHENQREPGVTACLRQVKFTSRRIPRQDDCPCLWNYLNPALKGRSLLAVGACSPRRIAQGNALGLKHGNLNKALKGRNNINAREYGAPLQEERGVEVP